MRSERGAERRPRPAPCALGLQPQQPRHAGGEELVGDRAVVEQPLHTEAFAHGHATLVNPAAGVLPDAPGAVFAPTGFVPSHTRPAEAVPICGPGLALIMAGAFLIHRDA